MRIALVMSGGLEPQASLHRPPVFLEQLHQLAKIHEVHAFVVAGRSGMRRYELLGASVHELGRFGSSRGRTARALGRLSFELVREGPFDVVHAIIGHPPGLLAALCGRTLRIPSVVSLIGGELTALPEIGYGAQLDTRSRLSVQLALKLASRITVDTHFMRARVRSFGFDAEIIPFGVAPSLETDVIVPPSTEGPPWRLLYVAALSAVKDPMTLIEAFSLLRRTGMDVRLDIVGEDGLLGTVQRRVTALGLDGSVAFHGWLPHEQVLPFYRRADLLLQSSLDESAAMVVLEAAMQGVPTVGTRVGHVSDWAPERAVAVPVHDPEALAEATRALLLDEPRRRKLGTAAREWVQAHDSAWSAREFTRLYESLRASPKGSSARRV
jgi:glycosyltransferase involved in cell wall biosynthesis